MKISAQKGDLTQARCDLLVLNLFENVKKTGGAIAAVDKALGGLLAKEIRETNFTGKERASLIFQTHGKIPAKRVMVVGLGRAEEFNLERVRRVAAEVARQSRELRQKRVVSVLHGAGVGGLTAREAARAFAEGALLADYRYDKYHYEKQKRRKGFEGEITLVETDAAKARAAGEGVREGELGSRGATLARDLVNEPASVATPKHLVEHAIRIAKSSKRVSVKILDRDDVKKLGMGAFLAVAAGATEEPYFIHLVYKPTDAKKKVAIVGKGVTFDSGGLQTKPGDSMASMKCDMSGAAAVLGLFSVIAELAPKAEVHGFIAATENMPGRSAYKPGDIVRALNGKTIEIGHTDAEGRVTMADALAYAASKKPDLIIDLATLTGACVAALGEEIAGLMATSSKLADKIKTAAEESGERLWELPLASEYAGLVKSDVADLKNVSSTRYGGTITAGLFLKNFVDNIPWAHLDIAGPAYAERDSIPYVPKGGSGFGVRTLIQFLKNI